MFENILIFLFGLSLAIPLTPDAQFTLFDLVGVFVLFSTRRHLAHSKSAQYILLAFIIYLVALGVSYVVNGSTLEGLVRRSGVALLLMINVFACYGLMVNKTYAKIALIAAYCMFGMCFHYLWPVDARVQDLPIKFLLGIPLGVLVSIFFSRLPPFSAFPSVAPFVLLLLAIGYVFAGSRSNAGIVLAAGISYFLAFRVRDSGQYKRWFPIYLLTGLLIFYMSTELYAYVAKLGVFGSEAAGIVEFQESFFGNLLLGGRPEVAINLIAFSDSPLIGHGPFAQSPEYLNLFRSIGIYGDYVITDDTSVMYHSMLFSAGHEAGIFAMILWAMIFYRITFSIALVFELPAYIKYPALILFLNGFWGVLFSPLIPYNRWPLSLALAMAIIVAERYKSNEVAK